MMVVVGNLNILKDLLENWRHIFPTDSTAWNHIYIGGLQA